MPGHSIDVSSVRRTLSRHATSLASPSRRQPIIPMWATRQDARQIDKAEAGGDVTLATRAYVIRYRAEIADAPTSELTVLDGGLTLDVTNITEATCEASAASS